jgi:hypothetical protein
MIHICEIHSVRVPCEVQATGATLATTAFKMEAHLLHPEHNPASHSPYDTSHNQRQWRLSEYTCINGDQILSGEWYS